MIGVSPPLRRSASHHGALAAATPPRPLPRRPTRRDVAAALAAATPRCSAAPRAEPRPCAPLPPRRSRAKPPLHRDAPTAAVRTRPVNQAYQKYPEYRKSLALLTYTNRTAAVPTHPSIATRPPRRFPPRRFPPRHHHAPCRNAPLATTSPRRSPPALRAATRPCPPVPLRRGRAHPSHRHDAPAAALPAATLAAATPQRSPSRRPTRRDIAVMLAAATPRCSAAPRAAPRRCPPTPPSRRARRGASRHGARRRDATTLIAGTPHSP